MGTDHDHVICNYHEAFAAVAAAPHMFVGNCFCRTPAKLGKSYAYCGHPTDVCLSFKDFQVEDATYARRQITTAQALELIEQWKKIGMYRQMGGGAAVCLCCPCGCGFFRDGKGNRAPDQCTKGHYIEQTDMDACTHCGQCVEKCAYEARKMDGGQLVVNRDNCSGCGACEFACPVDAIAMVKRA